MSVVYRLESMDEFLEDAMPLFQAHIEELKETIEVELNIDMNKYLRLWQNGSLLILAAREKGKLIGYYIMRLAQHSRSKHTLVANEEALYLKPEHRKGFVGIKLVEMGLLVAKAAGAEISYCSSHAGRSIAPLLKHFGFQKTTELYMLKLENVNE